MIFYPINEKKHRKDKSEYIHDGIDISEKEFSLPMPPTSFIMNQGALSPTCVSHAVAMAVMVAINIQTGKWIKLSPFSMQAYLNNDGGGTRSWYIAEILCRFGVLPTAVFKERGDNPKLHDALIELSKVMAVEDIAGLYKGAAYAELDSFDDVKRALKSGYTVVGAVKVGKGFGNSNGGYEPVYPKGATEYHELEFNGWCEHDGNEYLTAINSHGKYSGDGGVVRIPRGRLIKDLLLIDVRVDHIKKKAKQIEFFIGANRYKVDGVLKEFEVSPYIKGDRTYLPVRFVAENLGATVEWHSDTGTARILSQEAFITISTNSKAITIDGKQKKMDVMPEIINGRMMCPIRHIAEALNCKVEWSAAENKAVITAL